MIHRKHIRFPGWLSGALLGLFFALPAFGQDRGGSVSGTVSDTDGYPLPGAAVFVKGTGTGTTTDESGNFTVRAKEGDVLTVSFLGFREKDVHMDGRAVYFITLEADSEFLEDVVVVGYDTQKKVNLTGSVAVISTEEFNSRPIVQASTALQGMAPGVTVTTAGGSPGGDSGNIQIRGIGSFGGSSSSPLILIDGVEGNLNLLDASQIDQISVLKDAASAAIYGNRAANGVILVTTKRSEKEKFSLSYRGYAGWQTPVVYPSVASAREYMPFSRSRRLLSAA